MCITLNSFILSNGESVKYLRTNIDPSLNFFTHIKSVEHKIFRFRGMMYKLKLSSKFSLTQNILCSIRIYLAILAKLLKLQRFDSINYLPSVRE